MRYCPWHSLVCWLKLTSIELDLVEIQGLEGLEFGVVDADLESWIVGAAEIDPFGLTCCCILQLVRGKQLLDFWSACLVANFSFFKSPFWESLRIYRNKWGWMKINSYNVLRKSLLHGFLPFKKNGGHLVIFLIWQAARNLMVNGQILVYYGKLDFCMELGISWWMIYYCMHDSINCNYALKTQDTFLKYNLYI